MKLSLPRPKAASSGGATAVAAPAAVDTIDSSDAPTARAVSKGRPTPKRRDSAVRTGPVAPAPKTRRQALARQRTMAKTTPRAGTATPMSAAARRERMLAGDASFLPKRDAGPLRALARDYVDSRRMISNFLLILFPISLLTVLIRPLGGKAAVSLMNALIVALLLVVFLEWAFTGRRVRALATARGIDLGRDSALSIGAYAGMRAYLPRRWRVPRPRVAVGEQF